MNTQNLLAVDTSSRVLSIAISTGAALYEANLEGTPRHSEQLIDLIQEGLKHLRLKKNELKVDVLQGEWIDAGTFEALFKATELARKKSQK